MGGFAIELDSTDNRYSILFNNARRLTLTEKGAALLADCGHIVDVSIEDIKDKNKADGLVQLLVCLQAGWMIVQVITRTSIGLPTTLLEVHVVAHIVCALVMYILWWHKPHQATAPTIIKGDWLPLIAYMYLASRMSGEPPQGMLAIFRPATSALEHLAYFGQEEDEVSTSTHFHGDGLDTAQSSTSGLFRLRPDTPNSDQQGDEASHALAMESNSGLQSLAEQAMQLYPVLKTHFNSHSRIHGQRPYTLPYVTELVQPHAFDWPNDGLLRRTHSLIMGMVL
ncbi:uncharacterized protein SETTUDRAFT_38048 [Exserohilum turcica Et28A]|uniref:Uncharacterized protein n=1 Tax=Exserohilum turcicum (strain 28A) TaxID=671987 RepID=R0IVU4_EXST2|nr:uncharacterized protein SETTUDRAFT_38048 [Exserohilum turcica Et28A]EOA88721.1 hypothetical protein SETTUDRAFT_38048 [Exserohilum turcica Et28A]